MASVLVPLREAFGAPAARLSGIDVTLNIGDTYTIPWSISADENVLLEATFEISGALTVTGPIQCAQTGNTSTSKVLDYSGSFAAFNGTITVRADAAGQHTVRMSEVVLRPESGSQVTTLVSNVFTVYVRTKEQTDASIAVQESIRREQEAEASRRQSEEAARAASISASASEEERRRKESEDAAYREWLSRSAAEAAEASRRASISQSEADIAASISASESEVEASISASESEVERTRPTEMEGLGYVRYTYGEDLDEDGEGDEVFYFVTPEGELQWPEDTRQIDMVINDVDVLALKTEDMADNTYLMYGMKEENGDASWYYWHRPTDEFFRFDYVHVETTPEETTTEETTTEEETDEPTAASSTTAPRPSSTAAPSTGTTLPSKDGGKKMNVKDVLLLVLSGALGGAALTALIFLLVLRGRKKEETPEEAAVPESAAASDPSLEGPREKTGDTDAVDLE